MIQLEHHETGRVCKISQSGMVPPSVLLLLSWRTWRRCKYPKDGGMLPVNSFLDRSSSFRNVRFPSEGGIGPTRPRSVRFREMTNTRRALSLHETPSQLQKWVLSFQDIKACRGSRLITVLNSSSDRRSVSLSWRCLVWDEKNFVKTFCTFDH